MSVRANIEPLIWDSNFFKISIAKLVELNGDNAVSLKGDVLDSYQLVQAKIDSNQHEHLLFLQELGFFVVDSEVDLRIDVPEIVPTNLICLDLATESALPALKKIASDAFSISRYREPWFSREDNARLYSEWVEKAVFGRFDDLCLIIRDAPDQIKGFVTLKEVDDKQMRIGLLAVNPDYYQQGVGRQLMQGALSWCSEHNKQTLWVATQVANLPALHLYIRSGATIASTSYWLYR